MTLQDEARQPELLELIGTLQSTQQRLVELTGGQVDALIDSSGQRHLLPVAQENMLRVAGTLQGIFRNAAVGIVSTDEENRIREANPAFCAMLGQPAEALLGRDLAELEDPAHSTDCDALVREVKLGLRQGFVTEKRFLTAAGAHVWTRVSVSALQDPAGALQGLVAIVEDVSGRKAAEAANQQLTARLAATIASITDAFFTLDAAGHFTHVNDRAGLVFGLPAATLAGTPIAALPGFGPADPFGRTLGAAAAQRSLQGCEAALPGGGLWLEMRAYPAAEGLTVVLHDITERRRRAEWQRLLEVCIAQLNHIVLITEAGPLAEPGPRIVFVNDAFEHRTGYSRAEVLGRSPRLLQGPKTRRSELDRIRAALEAGDPVKAELLNYTKSGEEFWIEIEIVPMRDACGLVTHFVAVEREITERRRYQTQLEQQAALLEQVQDAIIVHGADRRIRYWNRGAQRLYGWRAEEVVGKSLSLALGGAPETLDKAVEAVLEAGSWTGHQQHRHRAGHALVVDASWTLVRQEDGAPGAILSVHTDVTQRLELEQKLRQSQRLEAVGQLTGGVAHDFNNLLTVILGNTEMMVDGLEPGSELHQMAEMSMAAAGRAASLTSRLLAFSRRQALDPRPVDVNALLSGLAQMLERTLGEQVRIVIRTAADLHVAMIDAPQLETAVLNLCINARDAMPDGGQLTIETANARLDADYARDEGELMPGDYVMVQVSDSGTGMRPEILARAFEPFFTTKEVGQGSGLGLSMVYGFLKQSGGHVTIHSQPAGGTRVRMYLPRAHGPATPPEPQRKPGGPRGGRERVLVVEDDGQVRDHAGGLLRDLGYQVTEAADAAEALRILRVDPDFDLLFTDIVMPGGHSGPQLATLARQLRPGLRVLLTSGYNERLPDPTKAAPLPLLSKPYRRHQLAEKVREALDTAQ
ncbi:hybrid sensor histidine kinase/response regulator [Falsiroseomonas tokyonensis]|uniref:histidine kinase n=1 Tax=Falsiroseomonas tokyonensis TaxID=430521 RepID=A0ABV7BWH5_9PROT|nr:PAS domain S-box protein [Falsiroseomonas tokyonensis]MBU8538744.1 PAS domain S-box protein [Falsiroseomonas tokyonensis]